jgi:hypothetical protein
MKPKKMIELPMDTVASMIKDLSVIVVSLDRIGSAFGNDQKKRAIELDGFIGVEVFKKLAETRGILSDAYYSQSTKSDVSRLEAESDSLPYWEAKQK